jgi:PadR family transcriptional regulator, regulatory protein PadR
MGDTGLDLLRGTLDLLILRALAWQPLHGYAAAKWVRAASRDTLEIDDRALYIALHRLEERKLIRGRWQTAESGRKAKVYELTPAGKARLEADLAQWRQYVRAMGNVLDAKLVPQP